VKERLTGAIILVALIVLLVPELLTGPVRSATAPQPAATSAEESPLRSYTIDLADDTRSRGETAGSAAPQPAPATPGTPEPSTAAKPATISEGEPATTPDPEAAAGTSASNGAQVADNAEKPVSPQDKQASPQEKPVAQERPAHHLAAAKPSAAKPPEAKQSPSEARQSAPASEAGSGGSGWVVQLGVFASRANADRLAEELKGKGFKVAVSETTGNGRKLWRVRSAPLGDRGAAQDLAVKLRAAGATGSVVPRT
jgi:cell division septation protein DedD